VAHNTLAISDYGLIDEQPLAPRPNYWAAVLWRKFMGKTVLDPGPQPAPDLHVFAHCLRGRPGGVALLVINADRRLSHEMDLPMQSEAYSLTARDLLDSTVQLNGSTLRTAEDGSLPKIAGQEIPAGPVGFAPESITFVAIADARNPVCR
jgi:heparanase